MMSMEFTSPGLMREEGLSKKDRLLYMGNLLCSQEVSHMYT